MFGERPLLVIFSVDSHYADVLKDSGNSSSAGDSVQKRNSRRGLSPINTLRTAVDEHLAA
jgi:hypothetical protein